jgi:signal-transduction protein with cAMP-binding, CBS, and nucleotidyltransferase domain
MRNIGPMRTIPSVYMRQLIYQLSERKFRKNQLILRKGEISDYCYFVLKGEVNVYVQVDDIEQDDEMKEYLNNNYQERFFDQEGSSPRSITKGMRESSTFAPKNKDKYLC